MKIAIDIDEVLGGFLDKLIEFHNDVYKTDFVKNDFFSYKFWKVWGGTREEGMRKIYEFYETSYFDDIQPIDGAVNAVKKLRKENELFIITARQDRIINQTKEWVEKYFPEMFSEVYFANGYFENENGKKKFEVCDDLNVDVLVEDSLDNAVECLRDGRKIILFEYPWNVKREKRKEIDVVVGWDGVLGLI